MADPDDREARLRRLERAVHALIFVALDADVLERFVSDPGELRRLGAELWAMEHVRRDPA